MNICVLFVPILNLSAMSSTNVRRCILTGVASAAAYSKYVSDSYHNNPENAAAAQLAQIIPIESANDQNNVLTQTKSHFLLNKTIIEKSYRNILDSKGIALFSVENRPPLERISKILYSFFKKEERESKIRMTCAQAYQKETAETKGGNIVFYHGQAWALHYAADIYRELCSLSLGHNMPENYIPLRFSDKTQERDYLHMNFSLFGNPEDETCNSLFYFVHDVNRNSSKTSFDTMFKQFNLGDYYKKYQDDFDQLERLHSKATINGNLLLLSFTPHQASKLISTHEIPISINLPLGYTYQMSSKNVPTIINNIKKRVALKNRHSDTDASENWINNWYAMMPITKKTLDPETGPRVYSFNTADPDVMANYEKIRRELFDKIKSDIEKNKKYKSGLLNLLF